MQRLLSHSLFSLSLSACLYWRPSYMCVASCKRQFINKQAWPRTETPNWTPLWTRLDFGLPITTPAINCMSQASRHSLSDPVPVPIRAQLTKSGCRGQGGRQPSKAGERERVPTNVAFNGLNKLWNLSNDAV